MIRAACIVQMRLDSSRLPRKALLPLGDTVLAGFVMRRLKGIPAFCHVLACDEGSVSELSPFALQEGFAVFTGPKDDVLERYILAARECGASTILRATGDNPLVSVELATLLLAETDSDVDYSAFVGMPKGMGVELVKLSALESAHESSREPFYREHVCPYIYEHPERFVVRKREAPLRYRMPEASVTVDTEADYRHVQGILKVCGNDLSDARVLAALGTGKDGT